MINLARHLAFANDLAALQRAVIGAPWMRHAYAELGQSDILGKGSNPRVLTYLETVAKPGKHPSDDDTSWCSGFANWCMRQTGLPGSGVATARSWLAWGSHISRSTPCFGTIAVFVRGTEPWQGHVGFVVGDEKTSLVVLGGNQALSGRADSVCVKRFPKSSLLGLRWPTMHPIDGACRTFVAHRAH